MRAPALALERLERVGEDQLLYRLPKPQADGSTELRLVELIERPAGLILPPRTHRHRYHGVLAPNATLRPRVTALARPPSSPLPAAHCAQQPPERSRARLLWALLLARIYEVPA